MVHLNTEPIQVGDKIRLATWNCCGLSFRQRELCSELGYDILALPETHDTGSIQPITTFVTVDIAPKDDPYAGVAILMPQRIARSASTVAAAVPAPYSSASRHRRVTSSS